MENENIFRIQRKRIEQNFIGTFSANNFNPDYYVKASIPQKWIPRGKHANIKRIEKADYEETLINFLETPSKEGDKGLIIIIVGGIGTGKSTTIRYSLNKAKLCQNCHYDQHCKHDFPYRIVVDFLISPEVEAARPISSSIASDKPKLTYEEYWYHIIQVLDNSINNKLNIEEEISSFWLWLFENSKKFLSYSLYKLLFTKKDLFKEPFVNSKELVAIRENIYRTFNQEDLANYKLLQIIYLRNKQADNCNILIFDNIDSLEPSLQLKTLEFAIKASTLLKCKTIIPMRPHTFSLNNLAGDFIEIIEHWTPDLSKVIDKRITVFKNSCESKDILPDLLDEINHKVNSNNLMKETFHASSGGSIRYGLRNFYNFLLSHLIVTNKETKRVEDIPIYLFYQAYFCSETLDQVLYESNFVNILSLNLNYRNPIYSTIKLRLLHLIYVTNVLNLIDITSELMHFGYSPDQIVIAINDFLHNRKALVWSNSANSYEEPDLYKSDWLSITPLGIEYYEKLIHHLGYINECIVKVDNNRHLNISYRLRRNIEVLHLLENNDYKETIYYLSNTPTSNYLKYYEPNTSITSILWNKLSNHLKNTASFQSEYLLDIMHEEYIKKNIKNIIEFQQYPPGLE